MILGFSSIVAETGVHRFCFYPWGVFTSGVSWLDSLLDPFWWNGCSAWQNPLPRSVFSIHWNHQSWYSLTLRKHRPNGLQKTFMTISSVWKNGSRNRGSDSTKPNLSKPSIFSSFCNQSRPPLGTSHWHNIYLKTAQSTLNTRLNPQEFQLPKNPVTSISLVQR